MNRILKNILAALLIWIAAACDNTFNGVPSHYTDKLEKAFEKAGTNAGQLKQALKDAPRNQKEGMAYLIAYMPQCDLDTLTAAFLLENTKWAYKSRESFDWCKNLPDSVFFNEILPYASLNERRDNWRKDFFDRFSPLVKDCKTIYAAIDSVNKNIREIVEVEYNTKRKKADQSPYESMEQHMASCSGLSILLTDAFRAVGIPSRIAGTPMWTNMRGNHNWCEVWVDGQWYFTEYYPDKLNHSWFLSDAGKADPEKPEHRIYASSFKPTTITFPLVWDTSINYVYARNVTDRYIHLYQQQLSESTLSGDELILNVLLLKKAASGQNGNQRISTKIMVKKEGKQVDFGFTPGPADDMNKFLKFKLQQNTTYQFIYPGENGNSEEYSYTTGQKSDEILEIKLQ